MRLNRFIGNYSFDRDLVQIEGEVAHQIRSVLKLRAGEKIILGDGAGKEAIAEIISLNKDSVSAKLVEKTENNSEKDIRQVTLYCAILKRENFELVVQKATEIGVRKIVPLITMRTIKLGLRDDRLIKIIKEAAEQSGRAILPELGKPIEFEEALKNIEPVKAWFCDLGEESAEKFLNETEEISIFIGPEGGWDDKEREMAKNRGVNFINLGPLALRAETAAIIASYLGTRGK